jgi:hypothetical protein
MKTTLIIILTAFMLTSIPPVFEDSYAHEDGLYHMPDDTMIYCAVPVGPGMMVVCLDDRQEMCQKVVIQHDVVHGGEIFPCADMSKGS